MFNARRIVTGFGVAGLVWVCTVGGRSAEPPRRVVFDIPGRSDATPSVAASGSFVAIVWGASGDGKTDVFAATSQDGGLTFAPAVQVNTVPGEARLGGELPPRVALASVPGRSLPEVVVIWTARATGTDIKLARSPDGGRTFSKPVVLQSRKAAGDRGWPAVAVDARAGVHAIWLDHRGLATRDRADATHRRHDRAREHDGVAMAQKSSVYYTSVSSDPAPERALAPGVCYCCKTALAAGPSGSLYAAWRHVYPGNLRDMAFTTSADGGRSFGPPIRVSQDGWAIDGCPDDGPAMTVDRQGLVHLVWLTVIDTERGESALFHASWNGRTFTPRMRIPTLGPHPAHPQVAVDAQGRLVVAWDEPVNGRRVAAVRRLTLHPKRAPAFGEVMALPSSTGATHPVLAPTPRGFLAVWTAGGDPSRVEARIVRP